MKREVFIDASLGRIRAAVLEDGRLCEILSEADSGKKWTESVFLGRVQTIRPSINAAFVDIGEELNAFLPLEEGNALRCGEMIIVQGAMKQPTQSKGLRVTRRLNLAGKWLVLVPQGEGVHVSKKVKDEALREELLEIAGKICPENCGLIVRTASSEATQERLGEEAQALFARWEAICAKARGRVKPGILDERESLDRRLIRDLAGNDLARIVVNSAQMAQRLCAAQKEAWMPEHVAVELFEERDRLLFDAYDIETQIDKALRERVWLPCGGYLIIDPCEAMTVIDVNSGKMVIGRGLEETAFAVNMEAAAEIARQIRLRDIGGIVIVDFIDMRKPEHNAALLERMRECVKADRSRVVVEGMTRLGLMEMTRKRVQAELAKTMRTSCSYCSGAGELLSGEEVALRALRQVRRLLLSGQRGPFVIRCAQGAAQALGAMRVACDADVYVALTPARHAEKFDIEQIGSGVCLPSGAKRLDKGKEI